MKALPHVGIKHGEIVCCAGVTEDGEWRRHFPVIFRSLEENQQFKRWQWIEYDWREPSEDKRPESRRVQDNSIQILDRMPRRERAGFLDQLILESTDEAVRRGQTLALVRPCEVRFSWKKKEESELISEARSYEMAASQFSFFAKSQGALEPCPFKFRFDYSTADGQLHKSTCDDWETAAMFRRFSRELGETGALNRMREVFAEEYPERGMAFAMGTHSRRPDQWLLVGVIRVDRVAQKSLEF